MLLFFCDQIISNITLDVSQSCEGRNKSLNGMVFVMQLIPTCLFEVMILVARQDVIGNTSSCMQ